MAAVGITCLIRRLACTAVCPRVQCALKQTIIPATTTVHISNIAKRGLTTSRPLLHYPVEIQKPAPNFEGTAVVSGEFKNISLQDYKGKYLVLLFYPLDLASMGQPGLKLQSGHESVLLHGVRCSTFVCPTEIIAFSQKANEFQDVNTQVIGISVDSHFSHLAWINTPRKEGGLGSLNFPLLSDIHKKISQDYGVLLEDAGVALRGLFLIDPDGIVRHMSINDLPVGRSVEEVLRLVKAFQFAATHGEVCPAGWQPDSETIKPDPKGSKEYFEKVN